MITINRTYLADRTLGYCPELKMHTLELPWRDNAHNISCIPEGTYRCVWGYMKKHDKHHYEITNVKDRDGVFIHSGNKPSDFLGCIGFGDLAGNTVDLLLSRSAIAQLENTMKREPFDLMIKNAKPV